MEATLSTEQIVFNFLFNSIFCQGDDGHTKKRRREETPAEEYVSMSANGPSHTRWQTMAPLITILSSGHFLLVLFSFILQDSVFVEDTLPSPVAPKKKLEKKKKYSILLKVQN